MADFSYELEEIRTAIEETKNDPKPFGPTFVQIEAKINEPGDVEIATITGMTDVTWVQHGNGYTIIGTGNASLAQLNQGQDAIVVRTSVDHGGNFRVAKTEDVRVSDANGTIYSYGAASSRGEQGVAPTKLRKGKIIRQ